MRKALLGALAACAVSSGAWAQSRERPDAAIRIDQALLESPAVLGAERRATQGGKIKDLAIALKADGIHVSGKYSVPILGGLGFNAVIRVIWTGPDRFELRVAPIHVLLFDATRTVLDAVQGRLGAALKGVCAFQYEGEAPDGSEATAVAVDLGAMMPSLPRLYLSGIVTREGVIVFKAKMP